MKRLAWSTIPLLTGLVAVAGIFLSRSAGKAQPMFNTKPSGETFASERDGGFDPSRSLGYLSDLCQIGPRISGTDGMKKQQEKLQKHFQDLGARVEFQRFQAKQKSRADSVEMGNLVVSWHPERSNRVLLCSHYDTRPIADQEPDRRKWREPFLSANDGGSGVALLMELGNHMKKMSTKVGVDFAFFDGEEYVFEPQRDMYFFGSEYFAQLYIQSKPRLRYEAAILLDMIGGKNPRFMVEQNSWFKAGALVQEIWKIAANEKCTAFKDQIGFEVRDDHLALNKAGIPAVDVIDFEYPHWHRLTDVPANCSAESLLQVGRVVIAWLEKR